MKLSTKLITALALIGMIASTPAMAKTSKAHSNKTHASKSKKTTKPKTKRVKTSTTTDSNTPIGFRAFGGAFEKHNGILGFRGRHNENDVSFPIVILYKPAHAITFLNNDFKACQTVYWRADGRDIAATTLSSTTSDGRFVLSSEFEKESWDAIKNAQKVDFRICSDYHILWPNERKIMSLVEKYS